MTKRSSGIKDDLIGAGIKISNPKRKKRKIIKVERKKCESHFSENETDRLEPRTVEIGVADPNYLMELAKVDPIQAAAECQIALSTLHNGFNNRKCELLGACVGIAYNLIAVDGAWRKFCMGEFWKATRIRPKDSVKGRHKALRFVMRYLFHAKTKNEVNVTNRYAKMLEYEFEQNVPPEKIASIIQKLGGIEAMRRARVRSRNIAKEKREAKKEKKYNEDLRRELGGEDSVKKKTQTYELSSSQHKKIDKALDMFVKRSKKYFGGAIIS